MNQIHLVVFTSLFFMYNVALCANFTDIYRDEGDNVTLLCPIDHHPSTTINWIVTDVKTQKDFRSQKRSVVRKDGSLYLINVTRSDSHLYTCQDSETNQSLGKFCQPNLSNHSHHF